MVNNNLNLRENEKIVKDLTVLKLKKNFGFIKNDEYEEELIDLTTDYELTDFSETLSKIAFKAVLKEVENMELEGEDVKVLLNEKLELHCDGVVTEVNADVILMSKDSIEVIDIKSFDYDFINSSQDIDIKLLVLATIDKFLTSITNDKIRLTIIQPNLMTASIYETNIMSLLHQCEYNLI